MVMKHVTLRIKLSFHHDRDPNLGTHSRLASLKRGRRYSHNGVCVLVDFGGLAHDVWIRTKVGLPQPIADHRDGRASRLLVLRRQKATPKDRPHTQYIEIIRGRYHAQNSLGFTFACEAHLSEVANGDAGKTLLPIAHGLDVGIG